MELIRSTASFLRKNGFRNPEVCIVLGTGLGKLIDYLKVEHSIDYDQIPNFPVSTVEFHKGRLVLGYLEGRRVIAMQGRFHSYEGYTAAQVAFPIRVFKELGAQFLILSNAAGGINLGFNKGELMLIEDHINLLNQSPLTGPNIEEPGPRFPDMSCPYDVALNQYVIEVGVSLGVNIHKGVYAAVSGPQLETKAEYRFLKTIGADAVGMSTVPEVIVARQIGLKCCALSVITDICDPDDLQEIDISQILDAALLGEAQLIKVIPEFMRFLPR